MSFGKDLIAMWFLFKHDHAILTLPFVISAIGTFLFEERIGCFSNPMPEKAQDFIEHLQQYFRYLQPLMYNVPLYKLYKTSLWKKFEYHADKVFELGRYFIEKVQKIFTMVVVFNK